jgi:hypothetical protein
VVRHREEGGVRVSRRTGFRVCLLARQRDRCNGHKWENHVDGIFDARFARHRSSSLCDGEYWILVRAVGGGNRWRDV